MAYDSAGVVDAIDLFIKGRNLDEEFLTIFAELDNNREAEGYQIIYSIHPMENSGREFSISLTYDERTEAIGEYVDQKYRVNQSFPNAETRFADTEEFILSRKSGGNPVL